jgi:hypothetical protein
MELTREDASQALGEIDSAGRRTRQVRSYGYAAPFLILWGLIWLGANTVMDIEPALGGRVWLAGDLIGLPATLWLTIRQSRGADPQTQAWFKADRSRGLRIGMMWMTIILFFAAAFSIIAPLSGRQGNAFISLFWACAYMATGAWIGWRLFAIGVVTAAGILVGYHLIDQHYFLWMGVVGGGSLIAGGLWLRKL